ncbi:MAG: hypothetical protein CFE24_12085 [Flavobacterium sp. BFFFF2]|nr:MAG: hypothetical protein CFE24_12085 [Flavobacterium sp. BFFFF2]
MIGFGQSEKLADEQLAHIKQLQSLFKAKNIDGIAALIAYPLQRTYPIPFIKNEQECKQRFSEVFDQLLISTIANATIKQWSEVGWRGIMLDNGVLWIDSEEGHIIGVNYQSDFEKKQEKVLIAQQKENLYVALKTFDKPIYKISTKKYLIRIDKLAAGKYRYACWKEGEKESAKPDLILTNGTMAFLGSGGNSVISFTKGHYKYRVYRNLIGEDGDAEITLEVEKEGQVIVTQDGSLIE